MFKFSREQAVFEIGNVKIGGQPGEYPTVLAGTIFYGGHKIVSDPRKGIFDKAIAESLIKKQEEISDITGNPHLIQVFSESPEAMKKYIDFISSISKTPFLVDSTDAKTRIEGVNYAAEIGLIDKVIYNSINPSITDEEIKTLNSLKIKASIILAFNPKDITVKGKIDLLTKSIPGVTSRGLLEIAKETGISKPLIDVAILPLGSGAGPSLMSTYVIKAKLGLPVGSGIHNAVSAWEWLKKVKKSISEGREIAKTCDVASNILQVLTGGNFILYGPIENAPLVFPIIAMADSIVAEAVHSEFEDIVPIENHPFRKLVLLK
ncbi:MAG: tetrahydromethanopterin S-methyltransferase subunit H [Candidatus Methanomethylicia archaeon]